MFHKFYTFLLLEKVSSVQNSYLELRPCKPRLKRLRGLLDECPYSGHECEIDPEHQGKKVGKSVHFGLCV